MKTTVRNTATPKILEQYRIFQIFIAHAYNIVVL